MSLSAHTKTEIDLKFADEEEKSITKNKDSSDANQCSEKPRRPVPKYLMDLNFEVIRVQIRYPFSIPKINRNKKLSVILE